MPPIRPTRTIPVRRKPQVNKKRRMGNQKKNRIGGTFRNKPDFIHKEHLQLGMQVQLRLIKYKAGLFFAARVSAVKHGKQKQDFLQPVAFPFPQIVFDAACCVHNNRNGNTAGRRFKPDGFGEHIGKNGLDFCLHPRIFPQHGNKRLFIFVDLPAMQNADAVSFCRKTRGNFFRQNRFSGSVRADDQIHLGPVPFTEDRFSPQKRNRNTRINFQHRVCYHGKTAEASKKQNAAKSRKRDS